MRNGQEVHYADMNERFREELKSQRVASSNRAVTSRRRLGKRPDQPLRFGDLNDVEASAVNELAAPRDSWLGLESEY